MVYIYYSENDVEWTPIFFKQLLKKMPFKEQVRINKYVRWQDRQAGLIGKLLLMQGLTDLASSFSLDDIIFNAYNKPYFVDGPFFNISHSGGFVVCCISEIPVGIDIEKMQDIQTDDFKSVFTTEEWKNIQSNDYKMFYEYWTKKESVIKANGRGLSIPLDTIEVIQSIVNLDKDVWFLKRIEINTIYCCYLALPEDLSKEFIINIKKDFHEGLRENSFI